MVVIAGTVNAPDGSAQQGATVLIIDSATDSIVTELTTDTNGAFSYDTGTTGTYHVAVQYDDGTTQYNSESTPFIEMGSNPTGPSGEWTLAHDEQWDTTIANSPYWGYGQIDDEVDLPADDGSWSSNHVFVDNGQLVWQVESDGDETTDASEGTLNSASEGAASHHPSEGIPIDPNAGTGGVYMEAKIQLLSHDQAGLLPAWWCQPANQNWPSEIDLVENETTGAWAGTNEDPPETVTMTYHWATSGTCNDAANHDFSSISQDHNEVLSNSFHTYGLAWYDNSGAADTDPMLQWYYDGALVHEVTFGETSQAAIDTLYSTDCLPQGMQFSCHVNRDDVTGADLTTSWLLENRCDWLRVWHLA